MWYLYLDESGDLGFDFVNRKPSKFFTAAILVVNGNENRHLRKRNEWFNVFKEKVKYDSLYLP